MTYCGIDEKAAELNPLMSLQLVGVGFSLKNAVPLPDAYERCSQCQMTSGRLPLRRL